MLYFAYGSNLHRGQMRRRCPGSMVVGCGVVAGYRLVFPRPDALWRGGVAGIEADGAAVVEGVVYRLTARDRAALDLYEGVAEGDYTHVDVTVRMNDGATVAAMAYLATPAPGGPFAPSPRYLDAIVTGAREHGLSSAWLAHLTTFAAGAARA